MVAVRIEPAELPRDARRFVQAWWPVYRGDPRWVPPLIRDRARFLDPRHNPYFRHADVQCFVARGRRPFGAPLGTIAATVDRELQEREPGVGLFGFFEFVDEPGVAEALYRAAADWLRARGMHVARGPYNFNQNHEFGLLIDGFDRSPAMGNPYNRPYYPRTYEALGLRKVMDWYAYWLDAGPAPPLVERLARRVTERVGGLRIEPLDPRDVEGGIARFEAIFNDAWDANWGHVPMGVDEFRFTASRLRSVIDPGLCFFAYVDGECVAGSITLPDRAPLLRRMNGRLLPLGWWHAWRGAGDVDALRVLVLGVKHRYQHLGLGAPLYLRTWQEGMRRGVRGADASLILENNRRMRGALEKLGGRIYQTYRAYEAPLDGPAAR